MLASFELSPVSSAVIFIDNAPNRRAAPVDARPLEASSLTHLLPDEFVRATLTLWTSHYARNAVFITTCRSICD